MPEMNGGSKPVPVFELDVQEFCQAVANDPLCQKAQVVAGQVLEAIGGIAHLYQMCADRKGADQLDVSTQQGLVSEYVPRKSLVSVIALCTGITVKRSEWVLKAIEKVLWAQFQLKEREGHTMAFRPFGNVRIADSQQSSYSIRFENPLAEYRRVLAHGSR